MRSGAGWRVILGVAAMVAAANPIAGLPAAAAAIVTFELAIGSCAIEGDAPANEVLRVRHLASNGDLLGEGIVAANAAGRWTTSCLPGGPIKSGHRLVARQQFFPRATLRSFVVPPLSGRVDRVSDVLRVSGPDAAHVRVVLFSCWPGTGICSTASEYEVDTDAASGRYTGPLPGGFDARGGDRVYVQWVDPETSDLVFRGSIVPYMQVQRGSSRVVGRATPGASVHAQLKRKDGAIRGRASDMADSAGAWSARFRRNGANVAVATGNKVKGDFASDARLDVIATRVAVDLVSRTAVVTCIPNGRATLQFTASGSSIYESRAVGSSGLFGVGLASAVTSGWDVRLWCASRKGDIIYRKSVIP